MRMKPNAGMSWKIVCETHLGSFWPKNVNVLVLETLCSFEVTCSPSFVSETFFIFYKDFFHMFAGDTFLQHDLFM